MPMPVMPGIGCLMRRTEGIVIFRSLVVIAALALGLSGVVAQQQQEADKAAKAQQDLMKSQGKSQYGVLSRIARGQSPYDQAAVDAALAQMEQDVGKIAVTFAEKPKANLPDAQYVASPKVWENKADFDSKIPPVLAAIKGVKGKITDVASTKAAFDEINAKCNGCHETYQLKVK
jgi:cytochrome c556